MTPPSLEAFLQLSDDAVAEQVRATGSSSWAVAMGGTRRAYLADGGKLSGPADLEAYYHWAEASQRAVFERLFRYGVSTVMVIGRISSDRGSAYSAFIRDALLDLMGNPVRRASYKNLGLRVSFAGDLEQLGAAIGAPTFPTLCRELIESTATAIGPTLVYLYRGTWYDPASEEAELGYLLGQSLGRAPVRDELVRAYYHTPISPLSVYVGSGRPRIGLLRPPFISGNEDLYWAHGPLMRLDDAGWRRIVYDHLWTRKTAGNRDYPTDAQSQDAIVTTLREQDGRVIGLGKSHPLGFWIAD
jgi:hypothetical protein